MDAVSLPQLRQAVVRVGAADILRELQPVLTDHSVRYFIWLARLSGFAAEAAGRERDTDGPHDDTPTPSPHPSHERGVRQTLPRLLYTASLTAQ